MGKDNHIDKKTIRCLSRMNFNMYIAEQGWNDATIDDADVAIIEFFNSDIVEAAVMYDGIDDGKFAYHNNYVSAPFQCHHNNVLTIVCDDILGPKRANFKIGDKEYNDWLKYFTLRDCWNVLQFIFLNKDKKKWVVHCSAGISRSGAVCEFLCKYFEMHDIPYRFPDWQNIRPNSKIYGLLINMYHCLEVHNHYPDKYITLWTVFDDWSTLDKTILLPIEWEDGEGAAERNRLRLKTLIGVNKDEIGPEYWLNHVCDPRIHKAYINDVYYSEYMASQIFAKDEIAKMSDALEKQEANDEEFKGLFKIADKFSSLLRFNGGRGAVLCAHCSKIIRSDVQLTDLEIAVMGGHGGMARENLIATANQDLKEHPEHYLCEECKETYKFLKRK